MISQGNVSLRDARVDCGLSANGNMKVVEFSDRTGKTNPSLTDLRGTVLCQSSKAASGDFHSTNVNPGAACRPNYSEANIFSLGIGENPYGEDFYATLSSSGSTLVGYTQTQTGAGVLCGYSYVGRTVGGQHRLRIHNTENGPDRGQISIEVIGWPSGYFVGTPEYHYNAIGFNGLNETMTLNLKSSLSYITVCVQAQSWLDGVTGTRSNAESYECRMWKV